MRDADAAAADTIAFIVHSSATDGAFNCTVPSKRGFIIKNDDIDDDLCT